MDFVSIPLQDPSALHQALSLPAGPGTRAGRMRTKSLTSRHYQPGNQSRNAGPGTRTELSNPPVLSRAEIITTFAAVMIHANGNASVDALIDDRASSVLTANV